MFCPQCGTKVNGSPKFCPSCGYQLGNHTTPEPQSTENASAGASPAPQNAATTPQTPPANTQSAAPSQGSPSPVVAKKPSKKPFIIGGIAAVAVIAVVAVAAVFFLTPTTYAGTISFSFMGFDDAIELDFDDDGTATLSLNDTNMQLAVEGAYERVDSYAGSGVYTFTPDYIDIPGYGSSSVEDLIAFYRQQEWGDGAAVDALESFLTGDNIQIIIPDGAGKDGIEGVWGLRLNDIYTLPGTNDGIGAALEAAYVEVLPDGSFEMRTDSEYEHATNFEFSGDWTEGAGAYDLTVTSGKYDPGYVNDEERWIHNSGTLEPIPNIDTFTLTVELSD